MRRAARRGLIPLIGLAACLAGVPGCGGAGSGPAWPRSAGTVASEDWSEDGGESIAPHPRRAVEVERSAEPAAEAKPAEPATPRSGGSGASDGGRTENPAATVPVELTEEILGEEIIIEIED